MGQISGTFVDSAGIPRSLDILSASFGIALSEADAAAGCVAGALDRPMFARLHQQANP
jgi:hypothetical protein